MNHLNALTNLNFVTITNLIPNIQGENSYLNFLEMQRFIENSGKFQNFKILCLHYVNSLQILLYICNMRGCDSNVPFGRKEILNFKYERSSYDFEARPNEKKKKRKKKNSSNGSDI